MRAGRKNRLGQSKTHAAIPPVINFAPVGEFQAVEGALVRQSLAAVALPEALFAGGVFLADEDGQQGIVAEVVLVVEGRRSRTSRSICCHVWNGGLALPFR